MIDAAMRILDRSPDAQLSLRMVAKWTGVAAPSGIRHFADVRAMMSAYVRYAMERTSRYQLLFALSADPETDLEGPLRPAFRPVREMIEAIAAAGGKVPTGDAFNSALLIISLAHGRIALAQLAPLRPGNFAPDIEAFVLDAIDRLFS